MYDLKKPAKATSVPCRESLFKTLQQNDVGLSFLEAELYFSTNYSGHVKETKNIVVLTVDGKPKAHEDLLISEDLVALIKSNNWGREISEALSTEFSYNTTEFLGREINQDRIDDHIEMDTDFLDFRDEILKNYFNIDEDYHE